jgi:hypothetical protein
MSCRSHWDTSYAVQSDTRLLECDGLIPYRWFCHIYEMKPSDAIGASLNDITGVYAHCVTLGNETASDHLDSVNTEPFWLVCCIGFINDDLTNPTLLFNATEINTNPTYLYLCVFHT